jgi:alkylation response protein AidB-like acyl-CoA dehydrogenase
MKMQLETCRATATHATREVGMRTEQAALATSVAKSFIGEYASTMIQDCIQLHGGIGVTWEHDLHLYLRRATLNRAFYGTPEQHNDAIYRHFEELEPTR